MHHLQKSSVRKTRPFQGNKGGKELLQKASTYLNYIWPDDNQEGRRKHVFNELNKDKVFKRIL
jgi:hypothetical protein